MRKPRLMVIEQIWKVKKNPSFFLTTNLKWPRVQGVANSTERSEPSTAWRKWWEETTPSAGRNA